MALPNIDQLRRRPVDRVPDRSSGGIFDHWEKHSIHRIPAYMKDQNPKAYTPQLVSIGPYHHGAPHLAAMEYHKARSLQQFLSRSNQPFEAYCKALRPIIPSLLESYTQLDEKWRCDLESFVKLMVVDGSFLWEFMHGYSNANGWDYHPKDAIFSFEGFLNICPYIIPDVLMMENQIPLLVIEKLIAVLTGQLNEKNYAQAHELVYKFLSCPMPLPSIAPGLHVLDVSRKVITKNFHQQSSASERSPAAVVKSAWKLSEVGVRFRANIDTGMGISFQDGVLNLPLLKFDSRIELFFLNAMAFEKLHPTAGREVSSYVAFTRGLISGARDVSTLTSHCVLQNSVGSDEAVADLMIRISKNLFFDPHSELCEVRDSLNKYYAKKMKSMRRRLRIRFTRRRREWWRNLMQTYFKNPWTILSLFAATTLLVLTLLQTIYTMKGYYKGSSSS